MTALDTNVVVRYLVADDPAQARSAKALIARLEEEGTRAFVSDVVLCELVWVLTRSYGLGRAEVAGALRQLVAARQLRFASIDDLLRALSAYEGGTGDFADYLIREHARAAGCAVVATFDKKLQRDAMFVAP